MLAVLMALFLITPAYPHTQADTQLLADIMYLENGSTGKTEAENREVLILTACVVLNRMESGEWGGDTIEAVLNCPGQYASHTRNNVGKCNTPQYIVNLAEDILTFGTNVPKYVIFQSTQKNLGTIWKIVDGECFATGGGYKNEGFNHITKICYDRGFNLRWVSDVLRSAYYRERLVTIIRYAWWIGNRSCGGDLGLTNSIGGENR